MPTSTEYLEWVKEALRSWHPVRVRRMFGEAMVYVDDRPILLVCDNTVYVKRFEVLNDLLRTASTGIPYPKAKVHWILDLEDRSILDQVVRLLVENTPIPIKKQKKA
jgi:TfoX/Sxy family transcriptional regulator of competence genes